MTTFLLALGAFSAAEARPAAPAPPFADCVRLPVDDAAPRVHIDAVECRTWQVEDIRLDRRGTTAEAVQDGFVTGLRGALGDVALGAPTYADGRATHAITVRGPDGAVTLRGVLTWDSPSATAARGVMCTWSPRVDQEATCGDAVARTVKKGLPTDVPEAPGPEVPRLVGRPLTVPAGCQGRGDALTGGVQCASPAAGMVAWAQLLGPPSAAELEAYPAQLAGEVGADLADPSWSMATRTCTVEGATARGCWEVRQAIDGPDKVRHALAAVGVAAGIDVNVMCLWRGPADAPPPVCAQVLELGAP